MIAVDGKKPRGSGTADGPGRHLAVRRRCRQVEVPLRRIPATTLGYGHEQSSGPSAWTGSWTGASVNPSAARAISAITRAICAARAHGAWGRTSCKRQAIAS
jgi:hypothetical protein